MNFLKIFALVLMVIAGSLVVMAAGGTLIILLLYSLRFHPTLAGIMMVVLFSLLFSGVLYLTGYRL